VCLCVCVCVCVSVCVCVNTCLMIAVVKYSASTQYELARMTNILNITCHYFIIPPPGTVLGWSDWGYISWPELCSQSGPAQRSVNDVIFIHAYAYIRHIDTAMRMYCLFPCTQYLVGPGANTKNPCAPHWVLLPWLQLVVTVRGRCGD